MTGKVMPHSTVGLDPSGNYVVLTEGEPMPEWFTLDAPKPEPKKASAKTTEK